MARAKADDDDVTEAHDQRMTVHIITVVPPHEPRPGDPHYDHYMQAVTRMKRQRLWRCAIDDDYCGGGIELHHTHVEAMSFRDVDLEKINRGLRIAPRRRRRLHRLDRFAGQSRAALCRSPSHPLRCALPTAPALGAVAISQEVARNRPPRSSRSRSTASRWTAPSRRRRRPCSSGPARHRARPDHRHDGPDEGQGSRSHGRRGDREEADRLQAHRAPATSQEGLPRAALRAPVITR